MCPNERYDTRAASRNSTVGTLCLEGSRRFYDESSTVARSSQKVLERYMTKLLLLHALPRRFYKVPWRNFYCCKLLLEGFRTFHGDTSTVARSSQKILEGSRRFQKVDKTQDKTSLVTQLKRGPIFSRWLDCASLACHDRGRFLIHCSGGTSLSTMVYIPFVLHDIIVFVANLLFNPLNHGIYPICVARYKPLYSLQTY